MFLRRLLGSRQAAEDVMQETLQEFGSIRTGLSRKEARFAPTFLVRQRSALPIGGARIDAPREPVLQEPVEPDNETASLLSDAVARLSEEGRALIWLREVEGYSYDELAQVFDVPAGTVASRLFAAREELRAIWHAAVAKRRIHEVRQSRGIYLALVRWTSDTARISGARRRMPALPRPAQRVPGNGGGVEKAGKSRTTDNHESRPLGNGREASICVVAEGSGDNENSAIRIRINVGGDFVIVWRTCLGACAQQ